MFLLDIRYNTQNCTITKWIRDEARMLEMVSHEVASVDPDINLRNTGTALTCRTSITVLCQCCPESRKRVPFTHYNICERRTGLVPRVLAPLIERRMTYKKRISEVPSRADEYEKKQNLLKWLLVTSKIGIQLELKGEFRWIVFLRGIDMRRSDTPRIIICLQEGVI